jgi:hypothetical protein
MNANNVNPASIAAQALAKVARERSTPADRKRQVPTQSGPRGLKEATVHEIGRAVRSGRSYWRR